MYLMYLMHVTRSSCIVGTRAFYMSCRQLAALDRSLYFDVQSSLPPAEARRVSRRLTAKVEN